MSLTKLSLAELFPARESLGSDIPAGDGKTTTIFYNVSLQIQNVKTANFCDNNPFSSAGTVIVLSFFPRLYEYIMLCKENLFIPFKKIANKYFIFNHVTKTSEMGEISFL
jgi:hypothetical protein